MPTQTKIDMLEKSNIKNQVKIDIDGKPRQDDSDGKL